MNICIYSPIWELTEIFDETLEEHGENCFKFRTTSLLVDFLKNTKSNPDLLLLDYTSFNHDYYNIYNSLKKINKMFPIIFFNDPCLTIPKRTNHWILELKIIYEYTDKDLLDRYKKVFEIIEQIVEDPNLKPYIPLMQEALPFPQLKSKKKQFFLEINKNTSLSILYFKDRNKLPQNLFYLLNLFYDNRENGLTLTEIIELYKKDNKQISLSSLKVEISQLKHIIEADKDCGFFFLKRSDKYIILFYS